MIEQQIFTCPVHSFVTVVRGDSLDCHGTPGHRVPDCPSCQQVVDDAFDAAEAFAGASVGVQEEPAVPVDVLEEQ